MVSLVEIIIWLNCCFRLSYTEKCQPFIKNLENIIRINAAAGPRAVGFLIRGCGSFWCRAAGDQTPFLPRAGRFAHAHRGCADPQEGAGARLSRVNAAQLLAACLCTLVPWTVSQQCARTGTRACHVCRRLGGSKVLSPQALAGVPSTFFGFSKVT